MNMLQEQFERAHGDELINWLNTQNGTNYSFFHRGGEAPDLVYSFEGKELSVEVTAAYYDGRHAKFLWDGAKNTEIDIEPWVGVNPDIRLSDEVLNRISEKSKNTYGKECILLVVIPPGLTSVENLSELIMKEEIPSNLPFAKIYVAGNFPITSTSEGGYRVITIL